MKIKWKSLAGIVLFLTTLLGISSISMAASFPDVTSDAWYYNTVNWAADNGLILGYENGYFGPADKLERGQFITILYRMEGKPEQSFESGIYSDVEDGWFYSVPAVWGKKTGVMLGYEDGSFGPSVRITREEVATILYRYSKKLGIDTSVTGDINEYPDSGSVTDYAREAIAFAVGTGIIRGDQGNINPGGYASRADIATMLQRFIEYKDRGGMPDISNTDSLYTIEADVKLTGTGTGYHAKLVACTTNSAVSFGIQYDQWGVAPYTDKTVFLIENVASNDPGGQTYKRTDYASLDKTYHLMLTVQDGGKCDVYVNGIRVGSVTNSELMNDQIYLRVEGSGRKNGDSVHAEFSNIALKGSGTYLPDKTWGTHNFDENEGIYSDDSEYAANKSVIINGSVVGLSDEQDWDNAYEKVSGIIQFVE